MSTQADLQSRPPLIELRSPVGRFAVLVLLIELFSFYFVINQPWGTVHSFRLPIDDAIPLVPIFVVPYLFGFFFWGGILILWTMWRKPNAYLRFMLAMLIAVLCAYVVYVCYQSTVPRPEIEIRTVFDQMLAWVYGFDNRYNSFPSGHTFTTTIMLLSTLSIVKKTVWKVAFMLLAMSIVLATVLLKQHYILDPIAGAGLGIFAWWLSGKWPRYFVA